MARQRALTLLALTGLVAAMVTITRYTYSYGEPNAVRLMISHQKLIQYQQRLRLVASQNNSDQTLHNLLEALIQPKSQPLIVPQTIKDPALSASGAQFETMAPVSSSQSSYLDDSMPVPIPVPVPVPVPSSAAQKHSAAVESVPVQPLQTRPVKPDGISVSKDLSTDRPLSIKAGDQGPGQGQDQGATEAQRKLNRVYKRTDAQRSQSTAKSESPSKVDIGIDIDQKSPQSNQKLQQLDSIENSIDTKHRAQQKASLKPKLVFDPNDLKTTESMKIDKALGCDDDLGASLDLLVIVNSAVDHFEARRAIRETWGRFAVERGAYLFFLIGSTIDHQVQDRVLLEEQENQDLLQGHFIDNYFNLTLKTISMMRWVSDHCHKVKYVLKVDDDMFVNMQHITDFSETRYFNKCIIG